ncbi:hypothetical protein [Flavobacterium hungaricum]|uniref:Uncharacterized protein n=1 Tax=Flavobacterium hungaricum TaxID=2082725 RepID=A0ABR9TRH3_9FLAO|nr:hypothetical protein [Flavobacterium hungaricum]MBE8727980.1 hypothetical protein [Flavobacterium hungaricum]
MNSKYFKALPNFSSTNINVDKENGILKNTCIAQFGDNQNDSYFDELFLNDLVKTGNESDGGIKSRFGHPNMCSTSFGTYIGRYRNFNIQDGNVYADLHLDSITKQTEVEGKGVKMFDYIMHMADTNPDMFGNSIHIFSQTYEKPVNGKVKVLHQLEKFKAVDLVDDPAATDSLFSSNPNDLGVVVTTFLDNNPKIFDTISKKPAIIQDFFDRYANYSNRKSLINFNMSFLDNLKKKFSNKKEGETFDIDITLADGSIVTVVTEAEEPKVGDQVVDDTGSKVKDNEHLLPDGSAIVTVDGAITEIKDAPQGGGDEEPSNSEVMNSINRLANSFSVFQKQYAKTQKDNEAGFDLIADQFEKFDKKISLLGKGIKSKYEAPPAEQGNRGKGTSTYDADAARETREAIKKRNNK